MGMYSYFLGINKDFIIQKEYLTQSCIDYFYEIEENETLLSLMSKANNSKIWGYLTSDILAIWKNLFLSILKNPINKEKLSEIQDIYIIFCSEENIVFFWKVSIIEENVKLYQGYIRDANYFIKPPNKSKKIPISSYIKNNNNIYLGPSFDNVEIQDRADFLDEVELKIEYENLWSCIYHRFYLFKEVHPNRNTNLFY